MQFKTDHHHPSSCTDDGAERSDRDTTLRDQAVGFRVPSERLEEDQRQDHMDKSEEDETDLHQKHRRRVDQMYSDSFRYE